MIELHGTIHSVICVNCKHQIHRAKFQEELEVLNPEWTAIVRQSNDQNETRPDGDVDINNENLFRNFQLPSCPHCKTGILRPDVVLFGDNVPLERVERANSIITNVSIITLILWHFCELFL